jgi:hypothetical protein
VEEEFVPCFGLAGLNGVGQLFETYSDDGSINADFVPLMKDKAAAESIVRVQSLRPVPNFSTARVYGRAIQIIAA